MSAARAPRVMTARSRAALGQAAAMAAALAAVAALCALIGASPLEVAAELAQGALGGADPIARVLATAAPLLLCAAGLTLTFRAGLYNLGVEGQVVVGALFATAAARALGEAAPGVIAAPLCFLAGAAGGALWGALAGALHVRARVSEIFAGLGLNFVAQALALYLVFGPWKRPGVASMAGTDPIAEPLWLRTAFGTDAAPASLLLAAVVVAAVAVASRGTRFGLELRAVGLGRRAAEILGVPAARRLTTALALSGALAGLAGAAQVLGVFHRLIPSISSNLGFLALLVAMLARHDARLVVPVALLFSALSVGSLRLPLTLRVESALAGVLQGALVLAALLSPRRQAEASADAEAGAEAGAEAEAEAEAGTATDAVAEAGTATDAVAEAGTAAESEAP